MSKRLAPALLAILFSMAALVLGGEAAPDGGAPPSRVTSQRPGTTSSNRAPAPTNSDTAR